VDGLTPFFTEPQERLDLLTHKWLGRRVAPIKQNFERFDSGSGRVTRGHKWEQRGPWGDIRSEQYVLSGFHQPDPGLTDLVELDWAQKKTIRGRSPGPLMLGYQYQFQLPEFWQTPSQRGSQQLYLSSLESLTQRVSEITQGFRAKKAI
jgi:hypothetical protein